MSQKLIISANYASLESLASTYQEEAESCDDIGMDSSLGGIDDGSKDVISVLTERVQTLERALAENYRRVGTGVCTATIMIESTRLTCGAPIYGCPNCFRLKYW